MQTVKVSPKFQVVIPKAVRERLKLRPGQELSIYEIDGQIRLDPPRKPKLSEGWHAASGGKKVTATMTKGSELVLVDSSGWVEFLGDGPLAEQFARYFEHEERLLVPAIVLYEVYKKLLSMQGSTAADRFLSAALRARVVALDERLAVLAARISLDRRLAMADAIIYATAQAAEAQLITSDTHFQGLPGATVIGPG